jgi:hypothetical protein
VLTIIRGTLPAAMFGREHYGAISGALAAPAMFAKAGGPQVFAMALDRASVQAALMPLGVMSIASLCSFALAVKRGARGSGIRALAEAGYADQCIPD